MVECQWNECELRAGPASAGSLGRKAAGASGARASVCQKPRPGTLGYMGLRLGYFVTVHIFGFVVDTI
jgi:hypothetical protein